MKKTIISVTLLFGLCMFMAGPALALPFTESSPTIGLTNGVPYTMTVSEATLATQYPDRDVIEPIVFTVEARLYGYWDPIDTDPDPTFDNQDYFYYEVLIGGTPLGNPVELTGFEDGVHTITTGPLTYNKLNGGDIEFSLYSQVTSKRELWNVDSAEVTSPNPEPCTLLLLGSGLLGAAGIRRKRFTKRQ